MKYHTVRLETKTLGPINVRVSQFFGDGGRKTYMVCEKPSNMSDEEFEQHSLQIGSWTPGCVDPIRAARHHMSNYLGIN